jgi:uncharacterized protein
LTAVNGVLLCAAYAHRVKRLKPRLLLSCGWTSLGLDVVGVVIPVLPTVPFVLLAAACFLRGSERRYHWLVSHPVFGPPIAGYLSGRGLRRRAKAVALVTLWAGVGLSVVVLVPLVAADVVLLCIAAAVSVYILRLPTSRESTADLRADRSETVRAHTR